MPIGPGTIVGPYEVTALVGEGGMGKVWRARHTALKRDDALKVLPDSFAADPARVERFRREAQVLASLNHPNIAQVHGIVEADGAHALVMEFVEGPTLADRIAGGALAWNEALPIARQIAEALEAAHQQGIVHRDLKPANIKVRPDDIVKVLDFGLAKIAEPGLQSSATPSLSPTTPAMTQAGMILGTPAYMSPEQARGRSVDARADIWAFGCVLFEMVTGRRAFDADDASLTLARVLERDVDLGALPSALPPRVRHAIALCLKKDPKQRISDIRDVRLMLDGAFDLDPALTESVSPPPSGQRAAWWLAAGAAGAVLGAGAFAILRPASEPPAPRVVRFSIPGSESVAPRGAGTGRHILALSPQGTHLVYWADELLHVRTMDKVGGDLALVGTERAREPFLSPDGQWVGFSAGGSLKRVSIDGGPVATIGSISDVPYGADWADDGMVRYGLGSDGIWIVPASGGTPTQLVKVDEGESAHGPSLLPGGEWVLFTLRRNGEDSWDRARIVAQSLRTSERRVLVESGRDARYASKRPSDLRRQWDPDGRPVQHGGHTGDGRARAAGREGSR